MGQIDLKGMIDQIMGMVKDSQAAKQNQSGGWYGGNKDEEEYWKDIRKRNTDMGLQEMKGGQETALEEVKNTRSLARQSLVNKGSVDTANVNAAAHKYTADQNLVGTKYSADNPKSAANNELTAKYFEAMNQPGANRDQLTSDFESLRRGSRPGGGPAIIEDAKAGIPAFVKPDLPTPGRATVPATVAPAPIRSPGARSMEFRSGESPEDAERKRRRMNKIYFQGTKYE